MTTPSPSPRQLSSVSSSLVSFSLVSFSLVIMAMVLILSACGSGAETAQPPTDAIELTAMDSAAPTDATDMPDISVPAQIVFEAADSRGDAPFAPDAEIAACNPEELTAFLHAEPRIAAAWAEAASVSPAEIADVIGSYTPTVLTVDTRVTNHAYRGGVARGFQATLEAGTAVLVDRAGVPRVRCACGNPLAPARPVAGETPTQVPDTPAQVPTTTVPVQTATPTTPDPTDFCTTWHNVRVSMSGGPSAPGEAAMAAYLDALVTGFDQLIAASHSTPDFPVDARDDLMAYRDAIATAAITPSSPGPGPEDALLGARVEDFLIAYCDEGIIEETPEDSSTPPTHVETLETPDTDHTASDPSDGSTGTCGSMQFALLVMLADDLGLDHASTSQPFVDAMQALVNGFDPGPEFDVSDLSLMLANEEIGCQGAQALQQLLIDNGYGPLIEGTELGA